MKIAILASNFIRLPPEPQFVPKGYSGAPEKIMWLITENLIKKGHEVTLFASGDSKTNAKLISVTEKSTSLFLLEKTEKRIDYENFLISKCYEMARKGQFDIIHSIFDVRSAFYAKFVSTPTVSTLHSPLTGHKKTILENFKKDQYYVSISNAQRKPIPDLNYIATIYHGIDLKNNNFTFNSKGGNYMLFVGRLVPEKGIKQIISIAKKFQKKTYLLGTGLEESDFWNIDVKLNIDNKLIYQIGFLPQEELTKYYQNSKLFLFPIQWEEPFGLVMIESMACGTPIVAFARGSVPEVIKDGETGFIVNPSDDDIRGDFIIKKTGIEGLCDAVEKIYSMPEDQYRKMRRACREHVEKNFTVEKMVDAYEKVYEEILSIKK